MTGILLGCLLLRAYRYSNAFLPVLSTTRKPFGHTPPQSPNIPSCLISGGLFSPRAPARAAVRGDMNGQDVKEECDIAAPEGYCSKFDDLGVPAFEKKELVETTTTEQQPVSINGAQNSTADPNKISQVQRSCIRLQALPDSCLGDMTTTSDVEEKIEQVKAAMDQYRRSDLYLRTWEPVKLRQHKNQEDSCGQTFNVMQFNTLAEGLSSAKSAALPFGKSTTDERKCKNDEGYGGFTEVPNPEFCLDFSMRKWRLLEVLIGNCYSENGSDPSVGEKCTFDLIACEEVDRFNGFFQPALAMFGYAGLFQPKPRAPSIPLGYYSDGCALFWKEEVFDLISQQRDGYTVGTQVYLIATLRHKPSGRIIVVAVTHLKAKESEANEKVRTMQATELINILSHKVSEAAEDAGVPKEDVPILVMGDLNSEPVGKGKSCVRTVTEREKWPRYQSVYPLDPPEDGYYTTWKTRGAKSVKRIIDYIFYNGLDVRGMKCTHILGIPTAKEIEKHRLPGFRYPSDHISIGARFRIDP